MTPGFSSENPGVGCGAAILRDGRLLLVKRLKAAGSRPLEPARRQGRFRRARGDAVAREIAEELGVAIEITRSLGFVEMIGDGQHWVSPIYLAEIRDGEPVNAEPAKHEAIVWADLDAPPAPLALAARAAIARLRPTALSAPSPLRGRVGEGGSRAHRAIRRLAQPSRSMRALCRSPCAPHADSTPGDVGEQQARRRSPRRRRADHAGQRGREQPQRLGENIGEHEIVGRALRAGRGFSTPRETSAFA